jgi:uncharacterized protein
MSTAPAVVDDPLVTPFYEGAALGELRIQRCQSCGLYVHLPRPVCRGCLSFDLAFERVSGNATLYSYTIATKPFHPFFVDKMPLILATVALIEQEGLHLLTNLVGVDEADLTLDMALFVDFQPLGDALTIPVFRPFAAVAS